MTKSGLLASLMLMLIVVGTGTFAIFHQLRRQGRLTMRLEEIRQFDSSLSCSRQRGSFAGATGIVADIGSTIARSGLMSRNTLAGLEQTLISSGVRGSSALGVFVGMKFLMMLIMPLLTVAVLYRVDMTTTMRSAAIVGDCLGGLLGPDWWIGWRYKRYLRGITDGLADALDLMVICAEAGLSFAPAMSRVAYEIRNVHPAVSDEFGQTASEFRMMADSKMVLSNMGARTNLDGIKRMSSMLAQTMKYGTPLSEALRVLSAEMRQEMLIRYETRAARLPVLLTIPMILFILPCIFLIVGGPAVIQVMHTIHHGQ